MADFPGPNATRAQIEAWRLSLIKPALDRVVAKVLHGKPSCAACGKKTDAMPLIEACRIKYSAKYKGRVFEVGAVLCHAHQTEPVCASCGVVGHAAGSVECRGEVRP